MAESFSFSQSNVSGGGEISPGSGTTGFTSNAFIVGNSSGQLAATTHMLVSGTTLHVMTSTAGKLGFFGVAGVDRPPAYTTVANTTGRLFPTTASLSTFTGVGGVGCAFTSRADMESLVRVVSQMYLDLRDLGLLR